MQNFLFIETATDVCSISLAINEKIVNIKENKDGRTHAADAALFANNLLEEQNIRASDLDAIAVSAGPGSYTGLRIGVSLAKGLCFGARLPLIAVPTLESMAYKLMENTPIESNTLLCPMLDARRMEVYCAFYDSHVNNIEPVTAHILTEQSFSKLLDKHKIVFFGSGAEKTSAIIKHKNARFINNFEISASSLLQPALNKFKTGLFEDVAYFEPFYLKEFMTTTPKKNVLGL